MKDVATNWEANSAAEGNGNPPVAPFINSNCFADPGDQNPGNAPRYFPGLRVNGIHNFDMNLYKSFIPKEGMTIDLRAEGFQSAESFALCPARFRLWRSGFRHDYF